MITPSSGAFPKDPLEHEVTLTAAELAARDEFLAAYAEYTQTHPDMAALLAGANDGFMAAIAFSRRTASEVG